LVVQAVGETSGLLIYYLNEPIEALFHADAGGHTMNSEDVWHSPLPYLRGVPELFPSQGPDANWTTAPGYSSAQLQQLLMKSGYPNPGLIDDIIIGATTPWGALLEVTFLGNRQSLTLEMGTIRTVLELKSNNVQLGVAPQGVVVRSSLALVALPETTYTLRSATVTTTVTQLTDLFTRSAHALTPLSQNLSGLSGRDSFVFTGKGWGHGVGLSQWGAKAMAENGYDFRAILYHYYTGVTIR
ncbi:MAG: SpoIID/LytB domain-containing protein, partial [Symbiobacteriaceae bacterium]|nr:SpoIID/LytB domain-containing protein [Symbiobacteriaceae bacterium]